MTHTHTQHIHRGYLSECLVPWGRGSTASWGNAVQGSPSPKGAPVFKKIPLRNAFVTCAHPLSTPRAQASRTNGRACVRNENSAGAILTRALTIIGQMGAHALFERRALEILGKMIARAALKKVLNAGLQRWPRPYTRPAIFKKVQTNSVLEFLFFFSILESPSGFSRAPREFLRTP